MPGCQAAVTIDRVLPVTHVSPLHHRRWVAPFPLIALLLSVCASASCAGGYALSRRDTVRVESPKWYSPTDESDRATLDRWSSAVGPPVIVRRNSTHAIPRPRVILIVSWNIGLGLGNVPALIAELRAREPDAPIVLLLQEAFRKGPEVPPSVPRSARFASRLGSDEHYLLAKRSRSPRIDADLTSTTYHRCATGNLHGPTRTVAMRSCPRWR